jgi:hypothetical protein
MKNMKRILSNRQYVKQLLWILTVMVFSIQTGRAQSTTATSGKEFYVSFFPNYTTYALELKIVVLEQCYITAKYNYDNTYWNNWNNTLVNPGIYTLAVDISKTVSTTTAISDKTISITSTKDITVYSVFYHPYGPEMDASVILPTPVWGTEYRIASGGMPWVGLGSSTVYIVIAKENNTIVTLHNNTTITLNKNQAYHYYFTPIGTDASGARIASDKPVAVFSGSETAYGPGQSGGYCTGSGFTSNGDNTYEQLWSADKWGTDYLVWNTLTPDAISGRDWGGIIGVIAHEANTKVTISGAINGGTPLTYTLSAGQNQYVCYVMSGLVNVTSDKPVMVYTILPDPVLTVIPPITQRITNAILSPFVIAGGANITAHSVEILLPAAYWSQTVIKENNVIVSNSTYTVTTSPDFPDWYTVRKDLSNANVTIEVYCPGGMLAFVYGSGLDVMYGCLSGAGSYDLQTYFTIRDKANTNDVHYNSTTPISHTFAPTDLVTVKRTIESAFTQVTWMLNGTPYSVTENLNTNNTLTLPATDFVCGENTLSMHVLFAGATADSVYAGKVWLEPAPPIVNTVPLMCQGITFSLTVSPTTTD